MRGVSAIDRLHVRRRARLAKGEMAEGSRVSDSESALSLDRTDLYYLGDLAESMLKRKL
jgi:hypothetical protein